MKQRGALIVLALAGLLLCTAIANHMYIHSLAIDWRFSFRPAAEAYFRYNQDPYEAAEFFNPPWALYAILPFALLPPPWDHALWMFVGAVAFAYMARKMGASPWALFLLFLSPPVLDCLLCGQLEWLVLLGAFVPFPWGLPLLLIKPQVGLVYAIWHTWQMRHKLEAGDLLTVSVFFLWSFVLFGFWPVHMLEAADQTFAWPYLIPVGMALAYKAWRDGDTRAALMASPFLSPHAWPYSFAGVVLALAGDTRLLAVVVAGMWAVKLLC